MAFGILTTAGLIGWICCHKVDSRTPQARCVEHLRQIGAALRQYAMDYDGFYPPAHTRELLCREGYAAAGIFTCPLAGNDGARLASDAPSYIFLCEGKHVGDCPFLVMDRITNHNGNALHVLPADHRDPTVYEMDDLIALLWPPGRHRKLTAAGTEHNQY